MLSKICAQNSALWLSTTTMGKRHAFTISKQIIVFEMVRGGHQHVACWTKVQLPHFSHPC